MSIYKSKFSTASREAVTELQALVAELTVKKADGIAPEALAQVARKVLGQITAVNSDPAAGEQIAMDSAEVKFLESLLPEDDPLRSDSPVAKSLAALSKTLDQAGRFSKAMLHVGLQVAASI